MKKFMTIAAVAMAVVLGALSFTSCDDNDDDNNGYYVRYSVGVNVGGDLMMSFSNPDPDGRTIVQQEAVPGTVEVTVGPVKSGFKAEMAASIDGYSVDWMRIDVAHDDKPFVMKKYLPDGISMFYIVGSDKE